MCFIRRNCVLVDVGVCCSNGENVIVFIFIML